MASVAKQKNRNFYVGKKSQVLQFINKCQPKYNEMEPKYKALCDDLQNVLRKKFPKCKVHRFGSTVTGLSFTDSDVDIFVELAEKNHSTNAATFVNNSKTLLQKYGHLFGEVVAIPRARTPICKFVHHPTKIKCDFNIKSVIGVYNSWFVRYYLSLDEKLGHLMMVIKYWAKVQGLVSTSDFSNYSLILMFIFYLQHQHSLPPVMDLQTANSVNVQEDWNVGIDYSFQFTSQSLKESTAEDILLGFFDYYASFNYQLDIICPFLGHPITKDFFFRHDYLEPLFKFYKFNAISKHPLQLQSEICVQDPFEQINNVTARIKSVCFKKFITVCREACQIFEKRPVSCRALHELFEKKRVGQMLSNRQRRANQKLQRMIGISSKFSRSNKKNRKKREKVKVSNIPS